MITISSLPNILLQNYTFFSSQNSKLMNPEDKIFVISGIFIAYITESFSIVRGLNHD